ncbi:REM2- and Rab-like small GTPase 1 isoform X2 [Cimex lectularius]|nr:REM2- and Rab-like small GTPase 1 isoform X2 [Cimex lectularius]
MLKSGEIVHPDWHRTAEGETLLQQFYNAKTTGRKLFGILEQPAVFAKMEEVSYKVIFVGKSGVGKSTIIARFAGIFSAPNFIETSGIRVTNVYWPVKIWDKIILFKLQCWDAGSNSLKKYSHISTACHDKADLKISVFSYNDANSFYEMSTSLASLQSNDDINQPALMVIGTRISPKIEVPQCNIWDFETNSKIKILSMPSLSNTTNNEVNKMAPLLNSICEKLWIRDQQYIMKAGAVI